jgi:hypothetical protein
MNTAPRELNRLCAVEDISMTEYHSQHNETPGSHLAATDPWDAPYFGVPVYLRYQADSSYSDPLPVALNATPMPDTTTAFAPAHAETDASAHDRSLPWDGPYFGAPIYLRYPAYPVATDMFVAANGQSPVAEYANPQLAVEASSTPGDEAVPATHISPLAAMPPVRQRQSWLARLFGGR